MYIVAIAWFFVATLIAISQTSLTASFLSLFFWGIAPLCLILWVIGTPARLLHKRKLPETDRQPKDQVQG